MIYMAFKEIDTEDSDNSLNDVNALIDNFKVQAPRNKILMMI